MKINLEVYCKAFISRFDKVTTEEQWKMVHIYLQAVMMYCKGDTSRRNEYFFNSEAFT